MSNPYKCPVTACRWNDTDSENSCCAEVDEEPLYPTCKIRISVEADTQEPTCGELSSDDCNARYFALKAKYEAVVKELNDRLLDRTTGDA